MAKLTTADYVARAQKAQATKLRKQLESLKETVQCSPQQELDFGKVDPSPAKNFQVLEVRYERVFPVPDTRFGTERIALTASVHNDYPIPLVIEGLKRIALASSVEGKSNLEKARRILKNRDDATFREVSWAEAYLATVEKGGIE